MRNLVFALNLFCTQLFAQTNYDTIFVNGYLLDSNMNSIGNKEIKLRQHDNFQSRDTTDSNGYYSFQFFGYDKDALPFVPLRFVLTGNCPDSVSHFYSDSSLVVNDTLRIDHIVCNPNYCPAVITITDTSNFGASGLFIWTDYNVTSGLIISINDSILTSSSGFVPFQFVENINYEICVQGQSSTCIINTCINYISDQADSVTISGQVLKQNSLANSGLCILYKRENNGLLGIDTVALDSGIYHFEIASGVKYTVLAMLDPSDPEVLDFFPSYLGEVVYWEESDTILLDSNISNLDINLVEVDNGGSGSGRISGTIENGIFSTGFSNNPVNDQNVILKGVGNSIHKFIRTDSDGNFEFPNLAFGNYSVSVEIPGVNSAEKNTSLNSSNSDYYISFIYDDLGIRVVLGSEEMISELVKIYPNPANDYLIIDLKQQVNDNAELKLFNTNGTLIKNLKFTDEYFRLEIAGLQKGVYILKIVSDKRLIEGKLIKE